MKIKEFIKELQLFNSEKDIKVVLPRLGGKVYFEDLNNFAIYHDEGCVGINIETKSLDYWQKKSIADNVSPKKAKKIRSLEIAKKMLEDSLPKIKDAQRKLDVKYEKTEVSITDLSYQIRDLKQGGE